VRPLPLDIAKIGLLGSNIEVPVGIIILSQLITLFWYYKVGMRFSVNCKTG